MTMRATVARTVPGRALLPRAGDAERTSLISSVIWISVAVFTQKTRSSKQLSLLFLIDGF
jgi:hypothetical protein